MINVETLIEGPMPITGPVKINREAVIADFRGCKIIQHGGNFRLHSEMLSIELDQIDALWIIQTLALGVSINTIMRRVCVWEDVASISKNKDDDK